MKTILFLSILLSSQAFAFDCTPGAIVYSKSSKGIFSSKDTSYQEDVNVSVPVRINGQWGCYKKVESFKLQKKAKKNAVQVEITPLKVAFKDVAAANTRQYVHIDRNKVYVASFICSGENMIGHTSYYDGFLNVPQVAEQNIKVSSVFVTGIAARILEDARPKSEPAMEKFASLYAFKDETKQPEDCFIPAIISTSTIDSQASIQRHLDSSFKTRTNSIVNGCSTGFKEKMKDFELERVLKKDGKKYVVSLPL